MIEPYAEGYQAGFYGYGDKDNPYEIGTHNYAEWQRGNLNWWCEYGDMHCQKVKK